MIGPRYGGLDPSPASVSGKTRADCRFAPHGTRRWIKVKREMFGGFRFCLAWLVVVYHLSKHHPAGYYSVYAFFTLSGFLMALVINKKYPPNFQGAFNFTINRSLRIYPPYLAMAAMSLVLLSIPGTAVTATKLVRLPDMGPPMGMSDWFQNIFIWGWNLQTPKLVPQVWSVYRELFYCVLIFVVLARYPKAALALFGASVALALWFLVKGRPFYWVYNSVITAGVSYSAGCCIYHFKERLRPLACPRIPLICLMVVLPFLVELMGARYFAPESLVPFYLNIVLSAYMILLLSFVKGSPRMKQVDQFLGNLSYPIFLCHFNVAIVLATLFHWPATGSDLLLSASILPIFGLAYLINRYVEQTIGYGYDKRRQEKLRLIKSPVTPAPAGVPSVASASIT